MLSCHFFCKPFFFLLFLGEVTFTLYSFCPLKKTWHPPAAVWKVVPEHSGTEMKEPPGAGGWGGLEPAAVIKHLWQREQGTLVTKCLNYRKPEHTSFVSALSLCFEKQESVKFVQWSIRQDGLVGLYRLLPNSFHCLQCGPDCVIGKQRLATKGAIKAKTEQPVQENTGISTYN